MQIHEVQGCVVPRRLSCSKAIHLTRSCHLKSFAEQSDIIFLPEVGSKFPSSLSESAQGLGPDEHDRSEITNHAV